VRSTESFLDRIEASIPNREAVSGGE